MCDGCVCRSRAVDGKVGDITSACEVDGFAVGGKIVADGVDELVMLAGAEAANGVVLLEAEAEWVDD